MMALQLALRLLVACTFHLGLTPWSCRFGHLRFLVRDPTLLVDAAIELLFCLLFARRQLSIFSSHRILDCDIASHSDFCGQFHRLDKSNEPCPLAVSPCPLAISLPSPAVDRIITSTLTAISACSTVGRTLFSTCYTAIASGRGSSLPSRPP